MAGSGAGGDSAAALRAGERGARVDDRFARQAAALRENLRERKRQARERAARKRGERGEADADAPPRG